MKIRIDEGGECPVILNHKRINDIHKTVQYGFDFFRIYVLSRRTENHALGTALEIEISVLVEHSHIPGSEPSVLREHGIRRLLILIVSEENIIPFDENLARNILRVG